MGQPPLGRRALVTSLMLGGFIVVMFVMVLLESLVPNSFRESFHWSRYQMTKDGEIYKMTQPAGKPLEITELNGMPLKDTKTGRPITQTDFNRLVIRNPVSRPISRIKRNTKGIIKDGYTDSSHFFSCGGKPRHALVLEPEWTVMGIRYCVAPVHRQSGSKWFHPGAHDRPGPFQPPGGPSGLWKRLLQFIISGPDAHDLHRRL